MLKAYISEWTKFFEQCVYLPQPFNQLEVSLSGKSGSNTSHHTSRKTQEDSIVKKVLTQIYEFSLHVIKLSNYIFTANVGHME